MSIGELWDKFVKDNYKWDELLSDEQEMAEIGFKLGITSVNETIPTLKSEILEKDKTIVRMKLEINNLKSAIKCLNELAFGGENGSEDKKE